MAKDKSKETPRDYDAEAEARIRAEKKYSDAKRKEATLSNAFEMTLQKKYHVEEDKANIASLKKALDRAKGNAKEEERLKAELHRAEEQLDNKLSTIKIKAIQDESHYRNQIMTRGSDEMKQRYLENQSKIHQQEIEDLQLSYVAEAAYIEANISDEKARAEALRKLDEAHISRVEAAYEKQKQNERDLRELQKERNRQASVEAEQGIRDVTGGLSESFRNLRGDLLNGIGTDLVNEIGKFDVKKLAEATGKNLEAKKTEVADAKADTDEARANFRAANDEVAKLKAEGVSDDDERLIAAIEKQEEAQKVLAEKQAAQNEAIAEKDRAALKDSMARFAAGIADQYKSAFQEVESMISSYKGQIDSRLQGSDTNYNKIMDKITTNLSMSPFVRSKAMIDTMKEAVDKGIAYNIEQRSFLETISDKIVSTFDAFDSNLMRLIKLQQADTTAARMGMEAALTQFLNGMFQDNSYLSEMYDGVAGALIDASSQLDRNRSAEFEYIVQKWLGSLASVGISQETVNTIAQGINYLGTGDVSSLAGNEQMQTLFAMSASKAGLEYSELLLKGLDASNTNKLLESMVGYLKEIAEGADNQVVRSAYGDVFNLSHSDMKAISNLTKGDIQSISSNTMSYNSMQSELENQMGQLIQRTSIAEMMSNLYNNAIFGVASDMVSNPATYAMQKMIDMMDATGVDIAIPFVNAMGFGLDLNATVKDIMKMGMGLAQATSLMVNILGGLGSAGGTNLDSWGGTEYTQRGSGMNFTTDTSLGGTSGSTYVANSSSDDMKNSSINSATDDADETSEITNKNNKSEHTFDDFYNAVVGDADSFVSVRDILFKEVYNSTDNFLGVRDTRFSFNSDNYLQVTDVSLVNLIGQIFGSSSLLSGDRLKVEDLSLGGMFTTLTSTDSTLKVTDENQITTNDTLNSIIGDSATTQISTKDVTLGSVLSSNTNYLSVQDSRLDFSTNKELKTTDNNLNTSIQTVFGKSSILDAEGNLKVSDSSVGGLGSVTVSATGAMSVEDGRFQFDTDYLKVKDTTTSTTLKTIFGESSLLSNGKLMVDSGIGSMSGVSVGTDGAMSVKDSQLKFDGELLKTTGATSIIKTVFGESSLVSNNKLSVEDSSLATLAGVTITGGIMSVQDSRFTFLNTKLEVHDSALESIFKQIFGETLLTSEGALKVIDGSISNLGGVNVNNGTLASQDSRLSFTDDAALAVYDSGVHSALVALFGEVPLTNAGVLKVYDETISNLANVTFSTDGLLKVTDSGLVTLGETLSSNLATVKVKNVENDSLAVAIQNTELTVKLSDSGNTVKLAEGTTVKVDNASLKETILEAMGYEATATDIKNIGDLITGLINGDYIVKVTNKVGEKIQVDTEALGYGWYSNAYNS